jgi:hypothetical protein
MESFLVLPLKDQPGGVPIGFDPVPPAGKEV